MSAIATIGSQPTMTSLELVDFINNDRSARASAVGAPFPSRGFAKLEHSDFMKKVTEVLGERAGNFSATYQIAGPNGSSRSAPSYNFPKREACLMAMSYSYDLQAKVFDRMTALEAQPLPAVLNMRDPKQLAAAAMQLIEVNSELQLTIDNQQRQIAATAPKAEALDRIADAEGLMNPTSAAKALQLQPKRVFDYMRTNGWTYRRAGGRSDVAYQDKIAAGYLTHKVHVARREDGSEKMCEQVMVTPKGLAKLAQVLGAH